jgi:FAD synthetase
MASVLAFGAFDIVHKGHEYYLREARKLGDKLTVVIARDKSVLAQKGKLPLYSEDKRKQEVEYLQIADKVILGNNEDRLKIILEIKPDIICLGYDQNSLSAERFAANNNLNIKIVRIGSFKPELYKSSKFKEINVRLPNDRS